MRAKAVVTIAALVLGAATGIGAAHAPGKHRQCRHSHHHRRCARHRHRKPHPPSTTTSTSTATTTTTTTTTGLPSRLEVDENDTPSYSLTPSHNPVAAGRVSFNVYNYGQDAHTFAIEDSSQNQLAKVNVPAGQPQTAITVNASLPPGTYTLLCTLSNHAALGMQASLTVQ